MAHGQINHIEFPADDPQRAMRFYEAVAGWEFSTVDGHARLLGVPLRGGLRRRRRQARHDTGQVVRDYIEVDSIEDALAAAERTGGTVKEPKRTSPAWAGSRSSTTPKATRSASSRARRAS